MGSRHADRRRRTAPRPGALLVDASGRDGLIASSIGRRARVPNLGRWRSSLTHQGAARAPGIDEGTSASTSSRRLVLVDPVRGRRDQRRLRASRQDRPGAGGSAGGALRRDDRRVPRVAMGSGRRRGSPRPPRRQLRLHELADHRRPLRLRRRRGGVPRSDLLGGRLHRHAVAELAAPAIVRRSARTASMCGSSGVRTAAPLRPPAILPLHRAYYEPAFLEIFLRPRSFLGMLDAVTGVLAGAAFPRMAPRCGCRSAFLRHRAGQLLGASPPGPSRPIAARMVCLPDRAPGRRPGGRRPAPPGTRVSRP